MSEILHLVAACAGGLLLGAMFFGGLWWTLRRALASERAALWFLGSLLLRTSVTLSGFYLLARGDWKRLLACLLGFVIARFLVTSLTGASAGHQNPQANQANEAVHASQS